MIPAHKKDVIAQRLSDTFGYNETVGGIVFRVAFAPEGHDIEYLLDLMADNPPNSVEAQAAAIILEML